MDIQTLQKHVLTLATIEETDAPMVSCYLNLETGLAAARRILDERVRLLRKTLPALQRDSFDQALLRIDSRLAAGFRAESLGAAAFSRSGDNEFFLDLEFRVPLPTWVAVSSTPNIYHLVELKDNQFLFSLGDGERRPPATTARRARLAAMANAETNGETENAGNVAQLGTWRNGYAVNKLRGDRCREWIWLPTLDDLRTSAGLSA